ncbi:MobF family relaxase [Nocardioides ungokensis]|uniref:MobF family relaxase n=1 Tax=Nocardioides ungokensis TaxID=1643322 RepID=UPI0015DF44DC|nr:MobF family relaxase [Nocardioides ungokensis]
MTVHKLTAGDGYTYLTRQVASADEVRPAGQSLADYYVDRGNPPGVWMGKGAEQLGVAGSPVTESQMKALFGQGRHPNRDAMLAAGTPDSATKLGAAYPSYADLAPYAERIADAFAAFEAEHGRSPSPTQRNQIAAKEARRGRRAVAGFDMVFTPVKSASLLWGLGGPAAREAVEEAHHEAVASALGWIEQHASYTRSGHGGAAQIDATGLVCAAFDHRESRSGDPDLHTHVAVANKVCGMDGKWRSLDARNLYGLGVAASEHYNTRFEDALARRLGVVFEERPGGVAGKRPIREIAGVPRELIRHFSRRRAAIEDRYAELRREYRTAHGREPDRSTQLQLSQQATLETREGKGPARTLAEQVADWTAQAKAVLSERRTSRMVRDCVGRDQQTYEPDEQQLRDLAAQVVRRVAEERSTWTVWNVYAEAERHLRPLRFDSPERREQVTGAVVDRATGPGLSIRIAEPELIAEAPALVRDSDGQSVFVPHGSERFTTSEVLLAEDRLVAAGRTCDGPHLDPIVLEAALAIYEAGAGVTLDPGQRVMVERFATAPARLAVGIGPAGSGKTTAMRAFADAWSANGGRVVPLATSSKAAEVLGQELGVRAENLHKFLHEYDRRSREPWFALGEGDVVLLDEAGMAGTLHLARLLELATAAGASVRLLGDPAQLAAVDAGGALRLLEREVGAAYLTDLHRFRDPSEGEATLQLRAGDPAALAFYRLHHRIEAGPRESMLELAYDRWAADVREGKTSVLVAAATDDVTALNARARAERVAAGQVEHDGLALHNGNTAAAGDWVVTRSNARTLRYGRGRWVQNGDTWQVTQRHRDGSLTVRHLGNGGTVRLGGEYVADSVELAYAATAHRVQGMTTDTAHALVTPEMTRESLYVASTRGREKTTWYAATEEVLDVDCHHEPDTPRTADELLGTVLARTGAEDSATETTRAVFEEASSLRTLVARYDHARNLASLEALGLALDHWPATERNRILGDPAAPHLARVVAAAAGQGADPRALVTAAFAFEDMSNVRSPALVLASRIQDCPRTLGVPDRPPADAPLPWLPAPDVGHPGWLPYLRERSALIRARAGELGSLSAAYRDQYGISDPGPGALGPPPETGTRQEAAYAAACREAQADQPLPSTDPTDPRQHDEPIQSRPTMSQQRGPRLSR